MARVSDYLGDDGIAIRWRRLFVEIVGATILAYFAGIVDIILSLANIPIALLSFLGNYYGQLIELVTDSFATVIFASFQGATQFIINAGPAGLVVAVIIVVATTYSIAEVVSRVR